MALYKRPLPPKPPTGLTEFEILKSSHKFLRDDEEKPSTWDDHLAAKYYSSLYREFAVCDLKHYKSGNFALRWRTEEEVLAGSAETTCGNTRCKHHYALGLTSNSLSLDRLLQRNAMASSSSLSVPLTTLELPFTYIEQGESKSALVKVVLCGKCLKKLMWKKTKEKEQKALGASGGEEGPSRSSDDRETEQKVESGLPSKRKHLSDGRRDGVHPEEDDNMQRRKKQRQEVDKRSKPCHHSRSPSRPHREDRLKAGR